MKIKEIMTKSVISLKPYNSMKDASILMLEHNIGCIPIIDDDNHPVGIITDRDMIIRGLAQNNDGNTRLEDIMTTNLITVNPEDEVGIATHIMGQRQIRRLLVVDEFDKLVGFLAMADISTTAENDTKAGVALSKISLKSTDIKSNPNYGVDVMDFPL
ncbi:CBS domain-containing protein [Mycoplasmatota bacterium]|nr:CBS domain-containing protein [Mycoplasmatota bacterium]